MISIIISRASLGTYIFIGGSMAKKKTIFECTKCGHEEPKWAGRCPQCGEWNSFIERPLSGKSGSGSGGRSASGKIRSGGAPRSVPLSSIEEREELRISTGLNEVDRVLGGGVIRGSSILLGGEPGIGKSTLLLQIAGNMRGPGRVLYVSGEESAEQIKMRARRLGIDSERIEICCETEVDRILSVMEQIKPVLICVDSIQTILSEELGAVPGTVNQIKYSSLEILQWGRERRAAVFLAAHVTKEGAIAGPKTIEHMVDTVLYFDHGDSGVRILRASKNRFGAVDEIGLFLMKERGLLEVKDPASIFTVPRDGAYPAGTVAVPVYEGTRILLIELQALMVPAKGSYSRVFSDRIDPGRVSRIAAVLEKQIGLTFASQDIYVNVAGGIRVSEVGVELPLAMALYSARTDVSVPRGTIMAGEISLAGEIRPTGHLSRRRKASGEMGFTRFLGPYEAGEVRKKPDWELVKSVKDAVQAVFSSKKEGG